MNILRFICVFALFVLSQNSILSQDWTSYKSEQKINDLVDTGNELLMATDAGLVVMNKTTLEKTAFNKSNSNLNNDHVPIITQNSIGEIWIGTYDVVLMKFNGTDFQDTVIPQHAEYNPQSTELYDFKIAPNGDFWLGTSDGIFQRQNQTWLHYDETDLDASFFKAWDIEINGAGEVFIASIGLYKFANGQWSNISAGTEIEGYNDGKFFSNSTGDMYFAGDLDQIGRFDGTQWETYDISFNGSQVLNFTEDTNGEMYFNTAYDGVFKLVNNAWVQQADAQATAFDNRVNYFHIDEQNNRWMNEGIHLSVDKNGSVQSTTISEYTLETNSLGKLHKGDNGNMYFMKSYSDKVAVLDPNGHWSVFPSPSSGMPFEWFNDLLVIADNDIWVTSNHGFHHYDGNAWVFTASSACRNIVVDSQGKIYICNDEKIYIIDNGVVTEYNVNNSPLSTLMLSGLGVDAGDNLWIAFFSWEGDNAIQKVSTNGTWTTYTDDDYPVIDQPAGDFCFDNEGNVWVPLGAYRAIKFDGTTWTNPFIENSSSIINADVHEIKMDVTGKLYFTHQYGVTTLLDDEWGNLLLAEEDVPNNINSGDSSIELDDAGTLWWGSARHGLFALPSAVALPVELLSFEVKATPKNQVKIDWSTATEIQHDFSTIERSKDGVIWETVATVAGKGERGAVHHYSELDDSPYQGTSFYRLKQVDLYRNEILSPIKTVVIKYLNDIEIEVYPNPTSDFLQLDLKGNDLETLSVFNHLGQDVTAQLHRSSKNQSSVTLNLQALTAGYYYLVVNGVVVESVFKQ